MAIIDFHAHYFSRTFFETLAGQSSLPGSVEEKLDHVSGKTGIELPTSAEAHLERWIAELDGKDVEHMATFASVPEEIPVVAEAAAQSGARLSAFALVNPAADGCADKVRRMLSSGAFKGLLVFPAMHHYTIDEERVRPVLDVLEEYSATVYVHCGLLVVKLKDLLGLPRPQDTRFANPLAIQPAANAFPGVNFVIPHFGAGMFQETLMVGSVCSNVFVDTSSSNAWIKTQTHPMTLKDVFARSLDVFGSGRILFGTDSNVFPAGWRRDRYEEQLAVCTELGLSADEREKIFADNARDLLARSGPLLA